MSTATCTGALAALLGLTLAGCGEKTTPTPEGVVSLSGAAPERALVLEAAMEPKPGGP